MNPKVFKIIDGKLYLNWSVASSEEFEVDFTENIQIADDNWKTLNTQP